MKKLCVIFTLLLLVYACRVDPKIVAQLPSDNIEEVIPKGWPQPVYRFDNNKLTKEGFVLGRALFYEPMLSRDNTISCSSCHQQFAAFAHSDHKLSHGINGQFTNRNAPALFNLNWHHAFFWDGGANHIEVQPLGPITNPVEMDENMDDVISKLSASEKYKALYKSAFGDETINTEKTFKALAQFMGMLYSYNSKYDLKQRGEDGGTFSSQEESGYSLFKQNCNTCHTEPMFTDYTYRNIGLSYNSALKDSGRMRITGDVNDKMKFKVPSLRNVTLSAPYSHDGRFMSLNDMIKRHTTGWVVSATLDPVIQNGINLSDSEIEDIIAFLNTLTDYKFVTDARFKDPNGR